MIPIRNSIEEEKKVWQLNSHGRKKFKKSASETSRQKRWSETQKIKLIKAVYALLSARNASSMNHQEIAFQSYGQKQMLKAAVYEIATVLWACIKGLCL